MLNSYLIKNAEILDLYSGERKTRDILVENGIITAMEEKLPFSVKETIDARGLTVTPGWVDDHAHFYYDAPDNVGINPERYFLPYGVTYAIDPGTAGADSFGAFHRYVRWNTDLKYKSYLNISKIGVPIYGYDLTDMSNLDEEACKKVFFKYKEELIGLKARITSNMCADPLKALQTIRRLCDELDTHFCVHATRCDLPTETILSFLRSGDMLTHTFARTASGILDEEGKVKNCVWEARERGVIFDMGHGINSFTFDTAKRAMQQGFQLDSISTDLHVSDVDGPVYDMSTTLSKFLALGVDVLNILRMVTLNPVRLLHLTDKPTRITVGDRADFTAFKIEKGKFSYFDCDKKEMTGNQRFVSHFTCVGTKIYTPRLTRESNRKIGNAAIEERKLQQKEVR